MSTTDHRIEAGSQFPSGERESASAVNRATVRPPIDTVLRELSDEPGPNVLLVHGVASSSEVNWVATRWVRSLAKAGFHVWSVDLPAHGMAGPAPLATRSSLCDEIISHARGLSPGPVLAIGYSLGAQLVYQCAAREPTLFSRVVLGGFSMMNRLPLALDAPGFLVDPDQRRLTEQLASEPFPADARVPRQPALLFSGADDAWSTPGDHAAFLARRRRTDQTEPPTEVLVEPRRDHVSVLTSRHVREAAVEFLAGRTPGATREP